MDDILLWVITSLDLKYILENEIYDGSGYLMQMVLSLRVYILLYGSKAESKTRCDFSIMELLYGIY